eukprot:Pgem_evm1s12589
MARLVPFLVVAIAKKKDLIKLHLLPRPTSKGETLARRKLWLSLLHRKVDEPTDLRICEAHFEDSCYDFDPNTNQKLKLKK